MIDQSVGNQTRPQDFSNEIAALLIQVRQYMTPVEIGHVNQALALAQETCGDVIGERFIPPLEHALAVATILAQMHIDAVGVTAGLIFEAVDADLVSLARVEEVLGPMTARVAGSMERFNILERKKQSVTVAGATQTGQQAAIRKGHDEREDSGTNIGGESKKPRIREALRRQQAETVRKMFVAMAEDPRVVLLKLAYRLHAMRVMCRPGYRGDQQEMLSVAQETREIYAPLAGRLGMSLMESELDDWAFKILEPAAYEWVRDIVESESKQWRSYVERVCAVLREEMATIGVKAIEENGVGGAVFAGQFQFRIADYGFAFVSDAEF